MTAGSARQLAVALCAACLATSCAPARPSPDPSPAPAVAGSADGRVGATPEPIDYDALFRARTDSARLRFTPADVHFMTGMIGHHAQALVMTALVPERTTAASIRTLAARITNSQADEIALMQQWLRDRGQAVPEVHVQGTTVMVHGGGHAGHVMPGMLTAAQLEELGRARGAEFDRLFLRYMIQHHRGAVTMVHDLFATDGAGQDEAVFKFAADVQVDQATEVARMERMLAAMPEAGGAQ